MLVVEYGVEFGWVGHGCEVGLYCVAMPGKIIRPALSSEVGIVFRTLWIEYSAHWNRVGCVMPGTVQPASALFMDPVASSTNITFNGTAVPPALAALDVEVSVIEGNSYFTERWRLVDIFRVTWAQFARRK